MVWSFLSPRPQRNLERHAVERRSVREVLGVDYAVSEFSNPDSAEPGRRFWKGADCPTLRGKTSMALFPVIAAHERGAVVCPAAARLLRVG
jgi:hypothetical protein